MEKSLTKGSPVRLLIAFALPVFWGNIFQIIYNLVDMTIVGRFVGVTALAAVGAVSPAMFCLNGAATGFSNGFGILIAKHFGANNEEMLKQHTYVSVFLSVSIGLLFSGGGILFLNSFLKLIRTPEDIRGDARAYLIIILAGYTFSMIYNLFACMLRAVGDSRTPLVFLVFSSILNVLLDLLFVVLFHLGVGGAALATVIAQAVSAGLCLAVILKRYRLLHIPKKYRVISAPVCGALLKMGIPMALQFSVCSIGVMMVQTAMNKMGSTVVAGYAVAEKLAGFVEQPYSAIGIALATYVGQNYGALKYDRIRKGVLSALGICGVITVILFGMAMTVAGPAAAMFVGKDQTEVIRLAQQYFRLIAWFFPCLGLIFTYRNALQGIGDGIVPMLASAVELAARALVIMIVGTESGFTGAAMANPLAWLAATLPLIPVFYRRIRKLERG